MKFISALLFSGFVAMASAQTIEPSGISFKVSGSPDFPILDTGAGSILEYDLSADRIDFRLGATGSYDNPFFCFDFSSPDSAAVTLNATDANGHAVMDAVGLASELSYNLADTISFSPSSSVQCFFQDNAEQNPKFGLFGELADNQSTETVDEGSLFSDTFAAFPELNIQYPSLQINSGESLSFGDVAVSPGDVIDYKLVIENTGNAAADELAFQEVFPEYRTVNDLPESHFTAALSEGIWRCVPSGNAVCPGTAVENPEIPGTTEGFGYLRFEPGSLELPAGTSSLTFTITRQVMIGSEGSINLFAGAVDGSGSIAKNAAAKETLSILEDPASMAFVQQPTDSVLNEPINPAVTIELLDDSGARLDVDSSTSLDLYLWTSDENSANRIRNGVTPENGLYTFDNIVIETAGEYFLRAEVEGLTDVDSQTFIVD
ncbi:MULTISPECIES: hypothetical protein [unclassified Wenzhouxiangella]|uniref:hypothetical protein n=1 Tax=unclassified Wenzhouxiangella TaxID=2613841 RepID=UPI000E32CD9E|nr:MULTISPECIES: hypothetical protein [unclassified Wenzhouxiangella]RFF28167.1 hypothetical protein DZK25_04045 [Wenzhouxiangella sp. 15181]RFP67966.1 hypothetical protein DZK26_10380 [Wenzhouxiangella sp. 15190]